MCVYCRTFIKYKKAKKRNQKQSIIISITQCHGCCVMPPRSPFQVKTVYLPIIGNVVAVNFSSLVISFTDKRYPKVKAPFQGQCAYNDCLWLKAPLFLHLSPFLDLRQLSKVILMESNDSWFVATSQPNSPLCPIIFLPFPTYRG